MQCADDSLYCGITTDVARRVSEHNSFMHAAAYTRSRQPVQLVYYETCANRSEALKREYKIKQMSKNQKQKLISTAA